MVGGIALARSGDDGDEVATADSTVPSPTISGACPFSLEPGPGVPTLEPAPRPVAAPPAALDPPTVGVGRVGELRVAVAVSTFPASQVQARSRWSSYEDGVAVGWLQGEDPIQVLRTGDLGLGPDLLGVEGGGHLGDADARCRDVLVQVVQPNPGAGADPTQTTEPGTGVQTSSVVPDPTEAPTTTGPCPANARCAELPNDGETSTTTSVSPTVARSCAEGSAPCDDTVVPGDEPDPADDDPAVAAEAEARALIEVVLGAIRFPDPAPTEDDDDTAGDSGTIVPGECPFSLDPAAGLPALEPGRSIDAPAALVAPTVGAGRVGEGVAIEVAVSTFPASDVQGQDRWSSPDDAVDIGWVEPGAVGVLPSAEDLAELGVGAGATQVVQAGGHLGAADEPCRDVLVRAYVSDGEGGGPSRHDDAGRRPDHRAVRHRGCRDAGTGADRRGPPGHPLPRVRRCRRTTAPPTTATSLGPPTEPSGS